MAIKSLYLKLAATLCGLFFLMGLFIIILTQYTSDMYQQGVLQKLNRDLAKNIIARKALIREHQVDRDGLEDVFHMMMVVNPAIEAYLIDPTGRILAYSAPPGKVKRSQVDLAPIKRWFESEIDYPLRGDDPRNSNRQKVFTAARIENENGFQGYLYIILGGESFDNIVQRLKGSYFLKVSIWWIAAGLLFILISGLLLFAFLTARLKNLAASMDSYDIERVSPQLPETLANDRPQGDEIERIAYTYKRLVLRIQTYVHQLKEADSKRRELIANLSHDLRTPLTNLQGYIESLLLKDQHLTHEKRHAHLKFALQQCKRLSKLIEALLELATLASREIQVNYEPFNINELVHDVVQKFELSAQQKEVSMAVATDPQLPFVNADIAMVERVIENILDNALRCTPSGGAIQISFHQNQYGIAVCISDTGCGIPPADQQLIFEPYYQRDKVQRGPSGNVGLGLAIAKQILDLHETSIRVESTPGNGASFTFELPVYQHA